MLDFPFHIILGSTSPRRRELLAGLDIDFEVRRINVDEIYPETLEVHQIPEFLALLKANSQREKMQANDLVLTADTIVICEGKVLGKPKNADDARNMLRQLSGKKHEVVSGVCLTSAEKQISFSDTTTVFFKKLTDEEIDYYIDSFHPFDKAGAYGIQEWIGYIAIEKIEGSYYTVMGLPVAKVYAALRDF